MTIRRSIALLGAATLVLAGLAQAEDIKCITTLNKDARSLSKVQNKEIRSCIKAADKAGAVGAEACSTADVKGKIAKAEQKTVDHDVGGAKDKCGSAPAFLYTGAANTNADTKAAVLGLAHKIFGASLDIAVVLDGDKVKMKCRDGLYHQATKVFDKKVQTFLTCKKEQLETGATSNAQIETACYVAGGPGLQDPDLKLQNAQQKLADTAKKKCTDEGQNTDVLFPGDCVGQTGDPAFGACVDRLVECRVCKMLNDVDGLQVDCDLFDDALANASCPPIKRVFVTSTRYSGNLGGLSGADGICQAHADGASGGPLGGTWVAWLSTGSVNAKDRIPQAEYRLIDGVTVVAVGKADLSDGSLLHAIDMDENGATVSGPYAWMHTGTIANGTARGWDCSGWTAGGVESTWLGLCSLSDGGWTDWSSGSCDNNAHLYCFEQ